MFQFFSLKIVKHVNKFDEQINHYGRSRLIYFNAISVEFSKDLFF